MTHHRLKLALREIHEFLLSAPESFVSREAYEERRQEVLNFFYEIHDFLLGAPKGDDDEH